MDIEKKTLTTKILEKDGYLNTETLQECMDFYTKTMDIVERTHIAMGQKKMSPHYITASTVNGEINTKVYASTY
jgi:hypothetical protein